MSETSSEVKLKDNRGIPLLKMDRNHYYGTRGANPWPSPSKSSGGAFGNTGGSSELQPKKYGGGFGSIGSSTGFGSIGRSSGFGSTARSVIGSGGGTESSSPSFSDFTSLTQRKEITGSGFNVSRGGFGVGGGFGERPSPLVSVPLMGFGNDRRVLTPTSTEENSSKAVSRRGGFGSSPRSSEVMSPNKRSRTGRRTGRRGRGGPGHCFHCQEHGHISRACPKKNAEIDEFEAEGEVRRLINEEHEEEQSLVDVVIGQKTTVTLPGRDGYQNAKLENQKARESYYGGYGYGKSISSSNNSTTAMKSSTGIESGRSSAIGLSLGAGGVGAGVGESAGAGMTSPDHDNFSEQLDNALKLHVVEPSPVASPRGLAQTGKAESPVSRINSGNKPPELAPTKSNSLPVRDGIKEISTETLTIETRRTVMREGEYHFEETTIINFPRVLPPNVRVITAQFVPVASSQG